jgi:hypothetical protein
MANETKYFRTPFAESGTRAEVPNASVGGAVGFDTGFGSDYELPQGSAGRKRIERDKYNGLHHSITKNLKQWQENIYPTWIEDDGTGVAFSYPIGMIVNHDGQNWASNEAANQEEPGAGTKWDQFEPLRHDLLTQASLNAVGGHDAIYRRKTTVAEIQSGVFTAIPTYLEVTDRGNAPFDLVAATAANGYEKIDAGGGASAVLQIKDKTVNLHHLGLKVAVDNAMGFVALNSLITSGQVVKVLMTAVYPTSLTYSMPVVSNNLSYIGLHGGIKPTLSGFNFTHTDGSDGFVIPSRYSGWDVENLYIKGNTTGADGFKLSGAPAANCTANNIYVKDWGQDGFYLNNMFIARFSNLMAEDIGRDGIHLDFANEIQIYGLSVERAGRWGVNNEDGYINTLVGNVSDCGTGATGGGAAIQKGGANTLVLYYESVNESRSRKAFFIGNKAIDTVVTCRLAKTDSYLDEGTNTKLIATARGEFESEPRSLLLNINNPCFELSANGTGGWFTNEGAVVISRDNTGDTGNFSIKAAVTGTSGNANLYTSGAGYSFDVIAGQVISVSFSVKTSRVIGVNGARGEFLQAELIGLSDAEPGFFNAIPQTGTSFKRFSMSFVANVSATNVRLRFKLIGLTAPVDFNITDIVFTTNLKPAKIPFRVNSTATDVAGVVADLNLLLTTLRGQGVIANS